MERKNPPLPPFPHFSSGYIPAEFSNLLQWLLLVTKNARH